MPNWRGLANQLIQKERERVLGLRRQKIYVWNEELKEWSEKEESVWLKNTDGKERPLNPKQKEKDDNDAIT